MSSTADLIDSLEHWSDFSATPLRIVTSRSGLTPQSSVAALELVAPAVLASYDCGERWLQRCADQLDTPASSIIVAAMHRDELAAVAVLRPKGSRRLKLATFFVSEQWRGRGLGTRTASGLAAAAFDAGYEKVSLTCPEEMHPQFVGVLGPSGFEYVDRLVGRYGERVESVFRATA